MDMSQLAIVATLGSAKAYIARLDPTHIATSEVGVWYEHPSLGDEAGLLVVPAGSDTIHQTLWMDVPMLDLIHGELY